MLRETQCWGDQCTTITILTSIYYYYYYYYYHYYINCSLLHLHLNSISKKHYINMHYFFSQFTNGNANSL